MLVRLSELEGCLRSAAGEADLKKAEALTMFIARNAPDGRIANLAMHAMSAAIRQRNAAGRQANGELPEAVSRLAAALRGAEPG